MKAVHWEDTEATSAYSVPDQVVDLVFDLRCRCLPVDHAYPLLHSLLDVLPWIADDGVGVHSIHGADSGNGWMRPENPQELLYLSRRTKLVLRLPAERVPDARTLSGRTLDVGGHRLSIEQANIRPLSAITTVLSRHVAIDEGDDETGFLQAAVDRLRDMGVRPKKMLCGRETRIATPDGGLRVRSLLLADLMPEESMTLQLRGLGPARPLGCGLFLGHKDVNAVKQKTD